MRRWLALRLESPLAAFGGLSIDKNGPTTDFPGASMLTGLCGNAMGWHWSDKQRHQALQDRIVFGARADRAGEPLTDMQNAHIGARDAGWTTLGEPESRTGGPNTYKSPHRRERDYHADLSMMVVLRLEPTHHTPDLDDLARAFRWPARPLFIGRKPCLPSAPIVGVEADRWIEAESAYEALRKMKGSKDGMRAMWPVGQGPETGGEVDAVTAAIDLRNWRTGLHGGSRTVVHGRLMQCEAVT